MQGSERSPSPEGLAGQAVRFPDFLCIGVQKAATSWLDRMLRGHPGLWLPPIKELQYFSEAHLPSVAKWSPASRRAHALAALERLPPDGCDPAVVALLEHIADGALSDDWYGRIFGQAPADRLCGEVTPEYSLLPDEGVLHVLRICPQPRIIICLRDPIERAWSHIRMMASHRGIAGAEEIEAFARQPGIWNGVMARCDYPAIIRRWRAHLDEGQFLSLFMEQVEHDPTGCLTQVCDLLGVGFDPGFFPALAKPVHVGEPVPMSAALRAAMEDALTGVYDEMARDHPLEVARWRSGSSDHARASDG